MVYKEGKYKLYVRACRKNGYDGDFILGYRDVDGVVHQIARFGGKNTKGEHYYQSVEFTAKKQIVSFVYFGCEKSKKSVIIDRVYIEGAASDKETSSRTKTDFKDISKIIDLNGKSYSVSTDSANDSGGNDTVAKPDNNKNESNLSNTDKNDNSSETDKPVPEDNSDRADDNSQTDVSGTKGTKTSETTTTVTTKGSDYTLYILIGAGVLGFAALFVAVCIIVVKVRNKKKGEVQEES